MKFFVDTADVSEIRELNDLGLIDGVTTNPSLIMKSGRDIREVTKEICSIVDPARSPPKSPPPSTTR
jgi:transaldolase